MQIPSNLHVNSNSEQVDDNDEVAGASAVMEKTKEIHNENKKLWKHKN
jgi:hypothetical protein